MVGAGLGLGHRVDAQFVGVARGAHVGDVAVAEVDAESVDEVEFVDIAEAVLRAEEPCQDFSDVVRVKGSGSGHGEPVFIMTNESAGLENHFFDAGLGRREAGHDLVTDRAGEILE